LLRSKEGVEVFSVPSERAEEASIQKRENREYLFKGNTSFQALHPHGSAVFVHRPDKGIFKLTLGSGATNDTETPFIADSARVQIMAISPQGSYLLTWERAKEGDIPNLKVWNTESGNLVIGFRQKSLSRDSWPYVQWTFDEKFAFLLGTNEVRVYPGTFPQAEETRFVDKMRIPGIKSMSVQRESKVAVRLLFTSFCPKDKTMPAMASLYEYPSKTPVAGNSNYPPIMTKSLFQAEEMKVNWSPKGDSALITLQNSVDATGESYYGSTSLYLMSAQETDVIAVPQPQEGPVLDVAWMPDPAKAPQFAVVAGKMPTMASLHNGTDGTATFLFGNAHRNTIVWAPHGRFICLAGFGNLAGGMTFWDRNKCKQIPPASAVTASCTVGYGWSPDSRLLVVSTTTPRMNVDNGVHLYRYNGDKMTNLPWNNDDYKPDRLLEASFVPTSTLEYPDRPQSPTLKDAAPSVESAAAPAPKPAGRYIPPSARNRAGIGGSTLAERMRAEQEGKLKGAQKVADKPKAVVGASGKVVVGMAAPAQGKSKSALRREKVKQKKEEEDARTALEAKVLVEEAQVPTPTDVPPENRARKIKKALKQIEDLRAKDPSSLNEDQKKKIDSEVELREELASLNL
jgi:translation initiation factor 2A